MHHALLAVDAGGLARAALACEDKEWIREVEILPGEQTLTFKRLRPGPAFTGAALTGTFVLAPVGAPIWIAGAPGKPQRVMGSAGSP